MVVRNLKNSLLNAGQASNKEVAVEANGGCHDNSMVPRKRTKVGVLISGTGVFLIMVK